MLELIPTIKGLLVPLTDPPHPRKFCPGLGNADNVTLVPFLNALPGGFTLTSPSPSGITVKDADCAPSIEKTAVMVGVGFVTVKVTGLFDPLRDDPQKTKYLPSCGTAVIRTCEPKGYTSDVGSSRMLPPPTAFVEIDVPKTARKLLFLVIGTVMVELVPAASSSHFRKL